MDRYIRHIQLQGFGPEKQHLLKQAKVLVIGAGGLGCPVLMNLASMGIGHIGMADGDIVEKHNLQRQLLYFESDIGMLKVIAAEKRLKDLNSDIEIKTYPYFIDSQNIFDLLASYDLVIDGTDQIHTRYLINDACFVQKIPWVYGAVFRYEGQVSLFNNQKKGETAFQYRDLFPDPQKMHNLLGCNDEGVLGILPNMIGHFMCAEAIKYITGLGDILSGKLLHYHMLTNTQSTFSFHHHTNMNEIDKEVIKQRDYKRICNGKENIYMPNWKSIIRFPSTVIIDVRNLDEKPRLKKANVISAPLHQIDFNDESWKKHENIIFVCQSGIRSKQAFDTLSRINPTQSITHIEGGILTLMEYFDHDQD